MSLKKFREEVIKLDGKCRNRVCLSVEKRMLSRLDPHHIIYRSHGGKDTAENGITLCRKCHDAVHNGFTDYKGKYRTGRQSMIWILEQNLGENWWRWDKAYEELKRKEPR